MKVLKLLILLPIVLLLTACPEDDPVKPDPCEGKKPVSAEFDIYEVPPFELPKMWKLYDTDTVSSDEILFVALEENAEYEWHLGSEVIKTKSFSRRQFPKRTNIPVTLIVRKNPDTLCYSQDDGIDTLTRRFYTIGYTDDGCWDFEYLSGTYIGFNTDSKDSLFEVLIKSCFKPKPTETNTLRIKNLIDSFDIFEWRFGTFGTFKQGYFYNFDHNISGPEGLIYFPNNNYDSIRIDYEQQIKPGWDYHDKRISKTFIGRRVK